MLGYKGTKARSLELQHASALFLWRWKILFSVVCINIIMMLHSEMFKIHFIYHSLYICMFTAPVFSLKCTTVCDNSCKQCVFAGSALCIKLNSNVQQLYYERGTALNYRQYNITRLIERTVIYPLYSIYAESAFSTRFTWSLSFSLYKENTAVLSVI